MGRLEGEVLGQLGVFDRLFAQQRDEVEAGRAVGLTTPFGEGGVSLAALGSEAFPRGFVGRNCLLGPRLFVVVL